MRLRKYFGKWLIVILLMAIGIGTYAAISLQDDGAASNESPEGSPGSYLTNQRKHDIDMDALGVLEGEYQAAGTSDATEDSGSEGQSENSSSVSEDSTDSDTNRSDDSLDNNTPGWWHLSIRSDYDGKGPYLALYDNGSGNPGVEGRIMYLKDDLVIVEIDQDLYEGMPADWQPEGDGKYAILDIIPDGDNIILGYRGSNAEFIPD